MCAICGYEKTLEVHHAVPRHVEPERALDPYNLVVLCDDCHFHLGHNNNYREYNKDILEMVLLLSYLKEPDYGNP